VNATLTCQCRSHVSELCHTVQTIIRYFLCHILLHTVDRPDDIYDMIQQAFGNTTMSLTQVQEWFRLFKGGGTTVESGEGSGRSLMRRNQLMIDKLRPTMLDNRRITIRELYDELRLSFGSVQLILTRFGHLMRLSEICPKNAGSRAERDSPCSSQTFAAVSWSRCKFMRAIS
jgi:hypothetical protein